MTVIVFGSINMDLVTQSPWLPVPGETLLGSNFFTAPGGKGANQAVAAARLGVPTCMVGRVGADSFGQELLASLQQAGVQTEGVRIDQTAHSGIAAIAVNQTGENHIIVVPGANGRMDATDVERLAHLLPQATALLLQFEIPLPIVHSAAQLARQAGVSVILDPAPTQADVPPELYSLVDIITPNEVEAEQLVGFAIDGLQAAETAATVLRQRGVGTVVIKLGAQGAFCATAAESFLIPAFAVDAIDTVAAGDAFNGGLAAALAEGLPLRQAVIWGTAAGALAATQAGAQSSMPDRQTFNTLLKTQGVI